MKNKDKKANTKKGFRFLYPIVILAVLIPLALVVLVMISRSKDDAEHIIVNKLTKTEIKSRFTPVEIYRLGKNEAFFAGSGSLFVGSEGEQIITSEHLFRKELGNPEFAFRKIRPLEPEITHGIHAILHKGIELGVRPSDSPDVVIIKTGDTRPIVCYSDRTLFVRQDQADITKADKLVTVRSLVSGESVRIVGTLKSVHDSGTEYVILDYSSFSGESGTGFVDENDQLYVLKGIPGWTGEGKTKVEKLLGISREVSIAYGPFQFRK